MSSQTLTTTAICKSAGQKVRRKKSNLCEHNFELFWKFLNYNKCRLISKYGAGIVDILIAVEVIEMQHSLFNNLLVIFLLNMLCVV